MTERGMHNTSNQPEGFQKGKGAKMSGRDSSPKIRSGRSLSSTLSHTQNTVQMVWNRSVPNVHSWSLTQKLKERWSKNKPEINFKVAKWNTLFRQRLWIGKRVILIALARENRRSNKKINNMKRKLKLSRKCRILNIIWGVKERFDVSLIEKSKTHKWPWLGPHLHGHRNEHWSSFHPALESHVFET